MKKRVSIPVTVLICLFCMVVTFQVTYVFCVSKGYLNRGASGYYNEKLAYVDSIYRKYFVGDIDEQKLTETLIDGYLIGAGEKYGSYLSAEEYAEYVKSLQGSLVGIGVSVTYNAEHGLIEVIGPMADTPAEQAGIRAGDLIYMVDGEDARDLGYYGTISAMRGDEGSEVDVTVLRGDGYTQTVDFHLRRCAITEQSVYAHMYANSDIGIIRITEFNTATIEQFQEALDDLLEKGAKKLLFDLRYNPGGELNSVTSVLDTLLPEGDIIITTDKDGNQAVMAKSDEKEVDMPMAVLINGSSASAAELFAASIRDYEKGALIGETTYGKGTMQTLIALPDGSALSVSYRMFTSAAGVNYEGIGIEPDIEVPLDEALKEKNYFKITDEEDNQLQAAIAYLNEKS